MCEGASKQTNSTAPEPPPFPVLKFLDPPLYIQLKSIGFLEKYDENICFRQKEKPEKITPHLQSGGIIKDFKKQKKKIRFRVLIILLQFYSLC